MGQASTIGDDDGNYSGEIFVHDERKCYICKEIHKQQENAWVQQMKIDNWHMEEGNRTERLSGIHASLCRASDKSLSHPYVVVCLRIRILVVPTPLLNLHSNALATACDVGVVIRLPICRSRYDGHPTCCRDDDAASYHGNFYWSRSTIERSGPMEQSCCRLKCIWGIGANLDLHLRGAGQCSREENLVLDDCVGVDGGLIWSVAGSAIT